MDDLSKHSIFGLFQKFSGMTVVVGFSDTDASVFSIIYKSKKETFPGPDRNIVFSDKSTEVDYYLMLHFSLEQNEQRAALRIKGILTFTVSFGIY